MVKKLRDGVSNITFGQMKSFATSIAAFIIALGVIYGTAATWVRSQVKAEIAPLTVEVQAMRTDINRLLKQDEPMGRVGVTRLDK